MSKFSQRVADLTQDGVVVIEVTQTVPGTVWQKTAHRIQQQVANGARRVAVVTNAGNPHADDVEALVKNARLVMPAIEIQYHKEPM